MIEGLENILKDSGERGLAELRGLLQKLFAKHGGQARALDQQALGPRGKPVFRLRFSINGQVRSVVVKRLKPEIAQRNELVVKRWLPAIGMNESGVPLLGSVVARNGRCAWHVYDDLGRHELDPAQPDRERVGAALELIARMHTRFAGHALLGEVRLRGGDLGIRFFEASVRDAIHGLEALPPARGRQAMCDRLLGRLYRLRDDLPRRAAALAGLGLPETLLHGDLWATNVFVIPTGNGFQTRLIDWDHASAGPFTYDLSTFLFRFPSPHWPWMLRLYEEAVARAGWRLPPPQTMNLLLQTHEFARYASCAIWPAIALVMDGGEWGFDTLEEIDGWFDKFEAMSAGENNKDQLPDSGSGTMNSALAGGDGAPCAALSERS